MHGHRISGSETRELLEGTEEINFILDEFNFIHFNELLNQIKICRQWQINDFLQKANRKKEFVTRPGSVKST